MALNLVEAIRSAVLTKPSSSWPTFDGKSLTRSDYLSASEASTCIRSLAFQKHEENATKRVENFWDTVSADQFQLMLDDMVPGKTPMGYFERGHNVEDWIVQQLRAVEQDDEHFLYMGTDQRSFYHEKHKISGTPDGLYINVTTGEMWLLEFKSSQVPITQPKYPHRVQVQVNMGLFQALRATHDMDEIVGVKLPEKFSGAKLLYIDSGNYIDLQNFDQEYDDGLIYNKMRAKSAALFLPDGSVQKPEKLAPQGLDSNGCHFCKHKMACAAVEEKRKNTKTTKQLRALIDKRTKEAPKMPTFAADTPREEVVRLLVDYNGYSDDEKQAKKQKDALKSAISVWIKTQNDMKAEFQDDDLIIRVGLSKSTRAGGLIKEKVEALIQSNGLDMADFVKADTDVETLRVTVKQVQ